MLRRRSFALCSLTLAAFALATEVEAKEPKPEPVKKNPYGHELLTMITCVSDCAPVTAEHQEMRRVANEVFNELVSETVGPGFVLEWERYEVRMRPDIYSEFTLVYVTDVALTLKNILTDPYVDIVGEGFKALSKDECRALIEQWAIENRSRRFREDRGADPYEVFAAGGASRPVADAPSIWVCDMAHKVEPR